MMAGESVQMLRALGSGVNPFGGVRAPERFEGLSFDSMLKKARAGEISSGEPVTEAKGAGANLTDQQLQRLAAAADRAEADGAQRALVLMDGVVLKLDVASREIVGVADPRADGVFSGYDSVITVAPDVSGGPGSGAGSGPLLRALGAGKALGIGDLSGESAAD